MPGNRACTTTAATYNGAISQSAARVRYPVTSDVSAQIGALNVIPSDLENDNGFKLNSRAPPALASR